VALDGDDFICGGEETDLLMGDEGNDILYGQRGDDELYCGDGPSDVADGGLGNNDFILVGYDGCESTVNIP